MQLLLNELNRNILTRIEERNEPPLDPCCFSSTHLWRHSWWTHFAVPRQRHGDTQQAEKSSSSVAKQTQQCLPGILVRNGILFVKDVRVPFDGGGNGGDVWGGIERFVDGTIGLCVDWSER